MSLSKSSFEELRAKCMKEGKLFEDPDFPATNKSISSSPVSINISWKRPPEFCKKPQFIVNEATRFDLDQGSLGNCWFIAAAATLATRPDMLERVVPKEQSFSENYAGIFRFNFWRYGEWKEVVVDDRLPVRYGKTLEFCRNKEEPDEFWSALLEKAYAKLNGSYGALLGGNIQDALVDLTGGVSEIINLGDKSQSSDDLYSMMEIFDAANSLMGSTISVLGKPDSAPHERGLLSGHAYCITGLKTITTAGDKKMRLIRLLNPWGETEWTGPWSDSSNEWENVPEDTRKELQLKVLADGEFWMSFEDWRSTFTQLQLCHLALSCFKHSTTQEVDWKEEAVHGAWVKGVNAGGCGCTPHEKSYWDNPQYCIVLSESDVSSTLSPPVVISLMQKEKRDLEIDSGSINIVIGFRLFRITRNEPMSLNNAVYPRETVIIEKGLYEKFREVAHHYDNISPGTYCIIPTTYSPNEEASFFLRVLTHRKARLLDALKIKDMKPIKDNLSDISRSRSMLGARIAAVNLNSGRAEPIEKPFRVQSLGHAPTTSREPRPSTEPDGSDEVDQTSPPEDLTPSGRDILEVYEALVGGGRQRRSSPGVDFGLLRRILTRVNDFGQLGGYKLHFGDVECRILFHMVSSWRERRRLTFDQVRRIVNIVKQWVRIFSQHDRDYTEFISFRDLWKALSSLGFELDDGAKEAVTAAYAANSEGLFITDFVNCVAKIQATNDFWKTKTDAKSCNISLQELLERVMLT